MLVDVLFRGESVIPTVYEICSMWWYFIGMMDLVCVDILI